MFGLQPWHLMLLLCLASPFFVGFLLVVWLITRAVLERNHQAPGSST